MDQWNWNQLSMNQRNLQTFSETSLKQKKVLRKSVHSLIKSLIKTVGVFGKDDRWTIFQRNTFTGSDLITTWTVNCMEEEVIGLKFKATFPKKNRFPKHRKIRNADSTKWVCCWHENTSGFRNNEVMVKATAMIAKCMQFDELDQICHVCF